MLRYLEHCINDCGFQKQFFEKRLLFFHGPPPERPTIQSEETKRINAEIQAEIERVHEFSFTSPPNLAIDARQLGVRKETIKALQQENPGIPVAQLILDARVTTRLKERVEAKVQKHHGEMGTLEGIEHSIHDAFTNVWNSIRHPIQYRLEDKTAHAEHVEHEMHHEYGHSFSMEANLDHAADKIRSHLAGIVLNQDDLDNLEKVFNPAIAVGGGTLVSLRDHLRKAKAEQLKKVGEVALSGNRTLEKDKEFKEFMKIKNKIDKKIHKPGNILSVNGIFDHLTKEIKAATLNSLPPVDLNNIEAIFSSGAPVAAANAESVRNHLRNATPSKLKQVAALQLSTGKTLADDENFQKLLEVKNLEAEEIRRLFTHISYSSPTLRKFVDDNSNNTNLSAAEKNLVDQIFGKNQLRTLSENRKLQQFLIELRAEKLSMLAANPGATDPLKAKLETIRNGLSTEPETDKQKEMVSKIDENQAKILKDISDLQRIYQQGPVIQNSVEDLEAQKKSLLSSGASSSKAVSEEIRDINNNIREFNKQKAALLKEINDLEQSLRKNTEEFVLQLLTSKKQKLPDLLAGRLGLPHLKDLYEKTQHSNSSAAKIFLTAGADSDFAKAILGLNSTTLSDTREEIKVTYKDPLMKRKPIDPFTALVLLKEQSFKDAGELDPALRMKKAVRYAELAMQKAEDAEFEQVVNDLIAASKIDKFGTSKRAFHKLKAKVDNATYTGESVLGHITHDNPIIHSKHPEFAAFHHLQPNSTMAEINHIIKSENVSKETVAQFYTYMEQFIVTFSEHGHRNIGISPFYWEMANLARMLKEAYRKMCAEETHKKIEELLASDPNLTEANAVLKAWEEQREAQNKLDEMLKEIKSSHAEWKEHIAKNSLKKRMKGKLAAARAKVGEPMMKFKNWGKLKIKKGAKYVGKKALKGLKAAPGFMFRKAPKAAFKGVKAIVTFPFRILGKVGGTVLKLGGHRTREQRKAVRARAAARKAAKRAAKKAAHGGHGHDDHGHGGGHGAEHGHKEDHGGGHGDEHKDHGGDHDEHKDTHGDEHPEGHKDPSAHEPHQPAPHKPGAGAGREGHAPPPPPAAH